MASAICGLHEGEFAKPVVARLMVLDPRAGMKLLSPSRNV